MVLGGGKSPAPAAPSITTQPASETITVGQSATFSVSATGTAPLTYQWMKNNVAITGAASPRYATPATTSSDNGAKFNVTVTNQAGSVTSSSAVLSVSAVVVAPAITTQPTSQTVTAGHTASFSVVASGTAPLAYQWKKNGVAISGATASSYTTPATTTADSGTSFTVTVSNSAGSATSVAATLTVNAETSTLQITSTQLPGGTVAVAYSSALAASGGTPPYSWSLSSGTLPTGLTLSSAGAISGTPSVAGSFPFTVSVKDSTGASASANFSITVGTAAPPSVSISSPSNGATVSGSISVSGVASDGLTISSVQVSVDGGTFSNASGTISWSFSLNTNSLSNGAHTLVAKVSDSGGNSVSSSLVDITVNNASTSTDCTLYASPSGGGNGTSSSSPLTFSAAASATQPGSVVCLLGGTYNLSSTFVPPNSGSPSSWIVYKNYDSTPVNFVWTGAADAEPMFKVGNGSFPSGPAYIQFQGLNLNGSGTAADGFFCRGGHHARFIGNSISDTGGSGIGSINCDYLVADHNLISHNGYIPSSTSVPQDYSWTSAISYNTSEFFDNYTGIHSVISNNIITGEVDQSSNHTDGNGIILDLGGNTPPALIVNNVVYGNGGRCIESNQVQNFYIINNTCFENALDPSEPNFPEFAVNGTSNGYLVNNIAYALSPSNPTFAQYGSVSNTNYSANLYFSGAPNFNATGFMNANPLFLSAPLLGLGGFVSSLAPSLLGSDLTLTPLLSPALGKGIDPSTISGLSASIVSDLKTYIYTDINGKGRPQGGNVDLGAYQQ